MKIIWDLSAALQRFINMLNGLSDAGERTTVAANGALNGSAPPAPTAPTSELPSAPAPKTATFPPGTYPASILGASIDPVDGSAKIRVQLKNPIGNGKSYVVADKHPVVDAAPPVVRRKKKKKAKRPDQPR